MSRLEKFIDENREKFDDPAPTEKLWGKIEAAVIPKPAKNIRIIIFSRWSAAAAVLIMIFVTVYFVNNTKKTTLTIASKNMDTSLNNHPGATPDEAPEMNQFAKIIVLKQEELKVLAKEQPELYKKFAEDINQLDSSYNTLKNQLSVTPNREMLIAAMIQNLQLQLNVLNQQLNIIHQIKKSKKYSHEKNKSFT